MSLTVSVLAQEIWYDQKHEEAVKTAEPIEMPFGG